MQPDPTQSKIQLYFGKYTVFALFIMLFFFSKDMLDMFKILIIDANMPFLKSLKTSLVRRIPAVAIQEAGSAAEGLKKINSFVPHLIFIDFYLADMHGLSLAKKIKTSYPEIIILLFASFDSPEYQRAAAQCAVEHLIPKDDCSVKAILDLVESILLGSEMSCRIEAENRHSAT